MAVGDAPDLSRELELEAVDQPPQARDVVDRFTRRDLVDRGFEDFERIEHVFDYTRPRAL